MSKTTKPLSIDADEKARIDQYVEDELRRQMERRDDDDDDDDENEEEQSKKRTPCTLSADRILGRDPQCVHSLVNRQMSDAEVRALQYARTLSEGDFVAVEVPVEKSIIVFNRWYGQMDRYVRSEEAVEAADDDGDGDDDDDDKYEPHPMFSAFRKHIVDDADFARRASPALKAFYPNISFHDERENGAFVCSSTMDWLASLGDGAGIGAFLYAPPDECASALSSYDIRTVRGMVALSIAFYRQEHDDKSMPIMVPVDDEGEYAKLRDAALASLKRIGNEWRQHESTLVENV